MNGGELTKLLVVLGMGIKYQPNDLEVSTCREELNELLDCKFRYEKLVEELEEATEAGKAAMFAYLSNKEDAELGKKLNLAMEKEQIGEIDIEITDMVIYVNTYDEMLTLEDWYKQQTESEERND